MTSKKRWKCETSRELVLENRIAVCEVGSSMLTASFGSVQSILKDNLNMLRYYLFHAWVIKYEQVTLLSDFAPPAERSRIIILTYAKTFTQSLKGTQNSFQRLSQVMRQAYSTTYKLSNNLGWTTQNLLAQKRQDKFTETSTACSLFFQHSDSCESWICPTRTN